MLKTIFILGEDKYVKVRIHSPNNEPFEISKASYKLSIFGECEDEGTALIDEHVIGTRISPRQKGSYNLEFEYKVVDTIRKARVQLEVI